MTAFSTPVPSTMLTPPSAVSIAERPSRNDTVKSKLDWALASASTSSSLTPSAMAA